MDTLNTRTFPPRHFPKNFLRASLAETNAIVTRIKVDPFEHLDYTAPNLQWTVSLWHWTKLGHCSHSRTKQTLYIYNYHVFLSDVTFCIFDAQRISTSNKTISFGNVHFHIQHFSTFLPHPSDTTDTTDTTVHGSPHTSSKKFLFQHRHKSSRFTVM